MDSVSVPMLGAVLSHPLPVIALVSYYLTNKLIGHRLLLKSPPYFYNKHLLHSFIIKLEAN